MDTERMREYLRLRRATKAAEGEAKALKAATYEVEQLIVEDMIVAGVEKISIGGDLIYLKDDVRAEAAEGIGKEQIADALVASGQSHFVTQTFNFNSISAWVRELRSEKEDLPEGLQPLVRVHSNKRLGNRRS